MGLTGVAGKRRAVFGSALPYFSDDENSHGNSTGRFKGLWGNKRVRLSGTTNTRGDATDTGVRNIRWLTQGDGELQTTSSTGTNEVEADKLRGSEKQNGVLHENKRFRIAVRHSHGMRTTTQTKSATRGEPQKTLKGGIRTYAEDVTIKNTVYSQNSIDLSVSSDLKTTPNLEQRSTISQPQNATDAASAESPVLIAADVSNRDKPALKGGKKKKKGLARNKRKQSHKDINLTSFDDLLSSSRAGITHTSDVPLKAIRGKGRGGIVNSQKENARVRAKISDRIGADHAEKTMVSKEQRNSVVNGLELLSDPVGESAGETPEDILVAEPTSVLINGVESVGNVSVGQAGTTGSVRVGGLGEASAKGKPKTTRKKMVKARSGKVAKLRESLKRQPKRSSVPKVSGIKKLNKNQKKGSTTGNNSSKPLQVSVKDGVDTGITGLSLLVRKHQSLAGDVLFDGVKGLAERERQRLVAADIEKEQRDKEKTDKMAEKAEKHLKRYACQSYIARKCDKGDDCKYHHNVEQEALRICSYFSNGYCSKGAACLFSHDCEQVKKTKCAYYLANLCTKGEACPFSHDGEQVRQLTACKYYLTNTCTASDKCKFSHNTRDMPCADHFLNPEGCARDKFCNFSHEKTSFEKPEYLLHITQARAKLKRAREAHTALGAQSPADQLQEQVREEHAALSAAELPNDDKVSASGSGRVQLIDYSTGDPRYSVPDPDQDPINATVPRETITEAVPATGESSAAPGEVLTGASVVLGSESIPSSIGEQVENEVGQEIAESDEDEWI